MQKDIGNQKADVAKTFSAINFKGAHIRVQTQLGKAVFHDLT